MSGKLPRTKRLFANTAVINSRRALCAFTIAMFAGGALSTGLPAQAWNPFHKAEEQDAPPPPGMTDTEDGTNDPLDKGFSSKSDDNDSKKDKDSDESEHKHKKKTDDFKAETGGDETEDEDKPAKPKGPDAAELLGDSESHGDDPQKCVRLARIYMGKHRYKDALLQVNEALKLNKNLWEARFLGAYIYQLQGRNDEAIERWKQYLASRTEDQQAHINLGVLLRQNGKLEDAEEEYRKAIELNYYNLQAHYDLANLMIQINNLQEGLKELRACEKISPTNAWVHNNLGVIYQRREYMEEAEQEFHKAANLEPANQVFVQNLTMAREQLARKKTAKATGHASL